MQTGEDIIVKKSSKVSIRPLTTFPRSEKKITLKLLNTLKF